MRADTGESTASGTAAPHHACPGRSAGRACTAHQYGSALSVAWFMLAYTCTGVSLKEVPAAFFPAPEAAVTIHATWLQVASQGHGSTTV